MTTQAEAIMRKAMDSTYGTLGAAVRATIRVSEAFGNCDVAVFQIGERRWRIKFPESLTGREEDAVVCYVAAPGATL